MFSIILIPTHSYSFSKSFTDFWINSSLHATESLFSILFVSFFHHSSLSMFIPLTSIVL